MLVMGVAKKRTKLLNIDYFFSRIAYLRNLVFSLSLYLFSWNMLKQNWNFHSLLITIQQGGVTFYFLF
jgi:hypothetical protein